MIPSVLFLVAMFRRRITGDSFINSYFISVFEMVKIKLITIKVRHRKLVSPAFAKMSFLLI
ncbi:hypothetical protein GCM10011506_13060 [Marivirga lumbricoides]|uniref:Uncharacterized protein n=1 Tax=Marivirga lumbricoides TaxID=1046115 RepID=A0ABQ1LS58_9BACT|nr:hypothetical protein GCM10011506_13060 [Marivirga lumbricoides]